MQTYRYYLVKFLTWCLSKLVPVDHMSRYYWFNEWSKASSELRLAKVVLEEKYPRKRDQNFMMYVRSLERKIKTLQGEITNMRESAEYRNKQIKAVGYIVYCTGCWAGGPDNKEEIDEEFVQNVERIAARLRSWHNNMEYKRKNGTLK